MAYKIMLDAGHGESECAEKNLVYWTWFHTYLFNRWHNERKSVKMGAKRLECYHIKRVYLGEITLEEILLHILYRSLFAKDRQND